MPMYAPWGTFLPGWNPQHLVIIGHQSVANRIMVRYRQTSTYDGGQLNSFDIPWLSIRTLLHIHPYLYPGQKYPSPSIIHSPGSDITLFLPNLSYYHFFYDINTLIRRGKDIQGMDRAECHFARAISWLIRNTRLDLVLRFWLSEGTRFVLEDRNGLRGELTRRPFSEQDYNTGKVAKYEEWDEKRLSDRVSRVKWRMSNKEQEEAWYIASDGSRLRTTSRLSEYATSIIGDGITSGEVGEALENGEIEFDWTAKLSGDGKEDDEFSLGDSDEDDCMVDTDSPFA
jgi:hypothetical protein